MLLAVDKKAFDWQQYLSNIGMRIKCNISTINQKLLIINQKFMKKLLYLFAFSFILMYSCTKDSSTLTNESPDLENVEFQMATLEGEFINASASISLEELKSNSGSQVSTRSSEDSHSNGHFTTQDGNTITYSSGEDGELGNFKMKGNLNFKGDVLCAAVEGNRVVIQVVVTSVGVLPDGFPDILGWTWLYLFEDNGEGNNAPSDRYHSAALAAPFDFGGCIEMTPSEFIGIVSGCPCDFQDTAKKSDQIQIK